MLHIVATFLLKGVARCCYVNTITTNIFP